LDRLVDAGVGGKAERFGAPSLQHSWPAGNDLLDLRIGLPPDARRLPSGLDEPRSSILALPAALPRHGMAFKPRDHGRGRHQLCLAHLVTAAGAMSP
jgi:hypothetical protein